MKKSKVNHTALQAVYKVSTMEATKLLREYRILSDIAEGISEFEVENVQKYNDVYRNIEP